jgi:ABC-2 type transport system permease protein
MKINRRTGTKIMYGSLILAVFAAAFIHYNLPEAPASIWEFLYANVEIYVSIIVLYAVIIAAGNIPGEFSKGTIKLLLIRPISRSKVLFSKYIATVSFSLGMLIGTFALSLVVGGIFFGFESPSQANLITMSGSPVENVIPHLISTTAFVFIDMLMMITIAFMISTIFRNSAMAIGLVIFLRFSGPNIVIALHQYDWAKYILFANLNLRQHIGGASFIEGLTMTFSVITLAVYFIIFIILTWWIFNKRDIAA